MNENDKREVMLLLRKKELCAQRQYIDNKIEMYTTMKEKLNGNSLAECLLQSLIDDFKDDFYFICKKIKKIDKKLINMG